MGPGFEWTVPEPVTVAPDAKNELQATLPLNARNVRVVDGEGAPRAHTHIVYWATTGVPGSSVTDAAGECTLAFLAGDPFFAPAPAPSPVEARESHDPFEGLVPAAQLTWSSGSGPLTVSF